ncbi:MAG TPA: hypothetical protein VMV92_11285 [Streptosporangiaceae bacterium]|nr:hypothetical protein [Streptosporangiaceae bacterium]
MAMVLLVYGGHLLVSGDGRAGVRRWPCWCPAVALLVSGDGPAGSSGDGLWSGSAAGSGLTG